MVECQRFSCIDPEFPLLYVRCFSLVGKYFEFKGWDKDFTNITEDIEVIAQYEEKAYTYTVTFYDEDGEIKLSEVKVNYGETAVYNGEIPTKEQNAQYTYTFSKWVDKEGNEASFQDLQKYLM